MQIQIVEAKKPEPAATSIPPAPAGAAVVEKRTPRPEELVSDTKDLYASMGWGEPPAAIAPVAPVKPEPEPEPELEKPEPQAEPQPEPQPEPGLTAQEMISQAAKETAREVAIALQPKPEPVKANQINLTAEDQDDLKVLRFLEKRDASKYAGLAQKFLDWITKRYEWVAKWHTENEGKEFKDDLPEYLQWEEENPPGIDADTIDQGRQRMFAAEEAERLQRPQQEADKRKKAIDEAIPGIARQVNKQVVALVEKVSTELLESFKTADGKFEITADGIKKLQETDPIAAEVIDSLVYDQLEPMLFELEKTGIAGLNAKLDPKSNPVHAQIVQFITEKEKQLAEAPAEVRLWNGKQWMPIEQFTRKLNDIYRGEGSQAEKEGKVAELERRHWCLTIDQTAELITDNVAKRAKKVIESRDAAAMKKYKIATKTSQTQPAPQPAPTPAPSGGKPRSPSLGGQAEVVTSLPGGKPGEKKYGEQAVQVMFS